MTKNGIMMRFNPNDPAQRAALYRTEEGPVETAAVLRMQRAGWPANEIRKLFGYKGTQLMQAMQKALNEEQEAARKKRPIHDATLKGRRVIPVRNLDEERRRKNGGK